MKNKRITEWLKAVLSNNESSTDEELRAYFIANKVDGAVADEWIKKRGYYLNKIMRVILKDLIKERR